MTKVILVQHFCCMFQIFSLFFRIVFSNGSKLKYMYVNLFRCSILCTYHHFTTAQPYIYTSCIQSKRSMLTKIIQAFIEGWPKIKTGNMEHLTFLTALWLYHTVKCIASCNTSFLRCFFCSIVFFQNYKVLKYIWSCSST